MFLSELQIKGLRLFKGPTTIKLHRGLNLFVGENGCGKSNIIDAIRILLNESEFFHRGLRESDLPRLPISQYRQVEQIIKKISIENIVQVPCQHYRFLFQVSFPI